MKLRVVLLLKTFIHLCVSHSIPDNLEVMTATRSNKLCVGRMIIQLKAWKGVPQLLRHPYVLGSETMVNQQATGVAKAASTRLALYATPACYNFIMLLVMRHLQPQTPTTNRSDSLGILCYQYKPL